MSILKLASTLTARYQTTIPAPIRDALGLGKNDKVGYALTPSGKVELFKEEPEAATEEDNALSPFLSLLDEHLRQAKETIVPYNSADAEEDLALVKELGLGSE